MFKNMSKKASLITAFGSMKDAKKEDVFYINSEVNGLNEDNINKETVSALFKKVRPERGSVIEKILPGFSYEEAPKKEKYNTVVIINLPYCLHLPQNFHISYKLEDDLGALTFNKIWTDISEDSDTEDIFCEDKDLYFNSTVLTTPMLPQEANKGWEYKFTGKNLERLKEDRGEYRYTKILLEFDTEYTQEQIDDKSIVNNIRDQIRERSKKIINYVLDNYRYITQEYYIERLADIMIMEVGFLDYNKFYYALESCNLGNALMNHSGAKIKKIEQSLSNGFIPPMESLLSLDAEQAFVKGKYNVAILNIYQALEVYLEKILFYSYKNDGMSDDNIYKKLNGGYNWNLKERLKSLIKERFGFNILEKDKDLWEEWCTDYDKVRNEVIHRVKEPSSAETKNSLELNKKVIDLIKGNLS